SVRQGARSGTRRGVGWRAAVGLVLVVVLALAFAGCSGAPEPDPPGDAETETPSSSPPEAEPTEPTEQPGPAERLGLTTGWGPSEAELDSAVRRARRLSLPELAGQLIVASWSGTAAPVRTVRSLHLGGVIAFDDNIASPQQIAAVNRALRRQVRRPWPLFLSVDQEGGIVERAPTTPFPAFMSAGAARDPRLTNVAYRRYGAELADLGFTVNFAPVADVTTGPDDPTIGSRSAGSGRQLVAAQAVAAAQGFARSGVVPVLKHFPGHGSVPADSHLTLPVQKRSLRQLQRRDLVPFAVAVDAGLPAVMVGHLDVRRIDPRLPSSLSRRVVTGLLRHDLGFRGLVVTDSLQMAAVTRGREPAAVAVRAIRAGADVLLMPPDPAVAQRALVQAVRRGSLTRSRLLRSAARQIALLDHSVPTGDRPARPGSASSESRRLSAAAITVVSGRCRGRLVEDSVFPIGDAGGRSAFVPAARAAGLEILVRRDPPARLAQPSTRRQRQRLAAWQAEEEARLASGTSIGFSGYGGAPVVADVAVATDTPYVLGQSRARVRIATYGETPGAMASLVDVLVGRATAPGRLPVVVTGVPRQRCSH
ncbi:glycoside hydrolase family 3 N-terminal domain-containing protein, partial [Nocardioides sp.]|uniref:glycoside hydrolase family 3 N-terminal domain-containing protein n=1 Tax=Nocardioides sp. TaxID=35761 RepID=UPI002ED509B6